jgi:hypothetical protein
MVDNERLIRAQEEQNHIKRTKPHQHSVVTKLEHIVEANKQGIMLKACNVTQISCWEGEC